MDVMRKNIGKKAIIIGPFFELDNDYYKNKEVTIIDVVKRFGREMYVVDFKESRLYCYKEQLEIKDVLS